jgi:hypothetical protein
MNRLRTQICASVFVLALIAPARVSPQAGGNNGSLAGTVLTGRNERIERAIVRLCDADGNLITQITTSDSGQFNFAGVQRGRYLLTFEAIGFQNTEIHLD